MRASVFFMTIFFSMSAMANLDRVELTYKYQEAFQVFVVEAKSKSASVTLKEKGLNKKTKKIHPGIANGLIREANYILWTSQYRMPASIQKCSEYAQVKIDNQKTQTICRENIPAAGRTYGLLQRLAKISQK